MTQMHSPAPSFTYLARSSPDSGSTDHSFSSYSPSSIGELCTTPAAQYESYHFLFQSPSSPYTFPSSIVETAAKVQSPSETKTNSASPRPKTSHAKKQPEGHIRRPRNAFILFRSDFVAELKLQKDAERDHRKISQIVGEIWNSKSAAEKAPWEQRARDEKVQHKIDHPDYRYSPAKPFSTVTSNSNKKADKQPSSSKAKKAVPKRKEVLDRNISSESSADDDDESEYEEERRKMVVKKVTKAKHSNASSLNAGPLPSSTTSIHTSRVHRRTSSTPNLALSAAPAATQRFRARHNRCGSDETVMSSATRARVQQLRADRSASPISLLPSQYVSPDDNTTSPLLYFNDRASMMMGGAKMEKGEDFGIDDNRHSSGSELQVSQTLTTLVWPSPLNLYNPLPAPTMTKYQGLTASPTVPTSSHDAFDHLNSFLNPGSTFPSHSGANIFNPFNPFNLPDLSRPNNGTMAIDFSLPISTTYSTSNSTETFGFCALFPPSSTSKVKADIHEMRLAELDDYVFLPSNDQSEATFAYETLLNLDGVCSSEPSPSVVVQDQQLEDFDFWLNFNQTAVVVDGFSEIRQGSDALMKAYQRGLGVLSLEE
ncbi:hypothetical protein FRB96_008350 [Tulasnella sp. 330]|nr:hypothetical protein FRB96_008350 [Tulasnella sp. 330]KAG8889871.1 hypothetical protein FRB98_002225 [Tulasnella sp. 332]